jgi:hypothetical protein
MSYSIKARILGVFQMQDSKVKTISDEILEVASNLGIKANELILLEDEQIRYAMIGKFAKDDTYCNFIWANLPNRSFASCRDPNAWILMIN